jgi:TolA-binding protein
MTTPGPLQQLADDIRSMQSKVGDMQTSVRLTRARDNIEDIQSTINGLTQRIASTRTRGYVFEMSLENQAQELVKSWALLYPSLQSQINIQSAGLQNSLRPIESQFQQLSAAANNPAVARGLLGSVQNNV